MMQQSHARYSLPWNRTLNTFDLLKLYAEFRGERDPRRGSYRYHSLASAGKQCGIACPTPTAPPPTRCSPARCCSTSPA